MRGILHILPLLLLLTLPLQAKKKAAPADTLSYERQQQFSYYYYEAVRCMDQHLYDKALAAYRLCLAIRPEDAACNNAVGRIYGALKLDPESFLERAYLEEPAIYWDDYVNFLWSNKRTSEAKSALEQVMKTDPSNTDAIRALIACLGQTGTPKNVLKSLEKLKKQEGVTEYYTQTITQTYLQLRKPKKAIEAIDYYLTNVDPDDFRFPLIKASICENMGDSVRAMKVYQDEVAKHPENPYIYFVLLDRTWSKGDYAQYDSLFMGLLHSEILDYDQKLKCINDDYKRILCIEGLNERIMLLMIELYPLDWRTHSGYANWLMQNNRMAEAEPYLLTAIDLCTDNQELWLSLYSAYAEQEKDAEIEELIERGYTQFPNTLRWHYFKTLLCIRHDLLDEGMEVALNATQMVNPTDPELFYIIWTQLADIYINKEMIAEGLDAYEKAVTLNPDYTYTLNNYAYILAINGGDLRKAEKMSQKTIQAEPDNATFLDTYAWILHLQGQDTLAAFYMKKAMKNLDPEHDNTPFIEHYNEILKIK